MMRGLVAVLIAYAIPQVAAAQPTGDAIAISATHIETFAGMPVGDTVGGMIWRGGLVFSSDAAGFGGISGITFVGPDHLVMVTDQGNFITGRTRRADDGRLTGIENAGIDPIRNSAGDKLPPNYSRDAEAADAIVRDGEIAAIRVGFENLTRVADFELGDNRPVGPAGEVRIPAELEVERTNQTLESVCIAPDASPIAGSTLLIAEDIPNEDGHHSAWLLGVADRGPLALRTAGGFNPTACAFLPDGDLLVLERGTSFLSFTMQLRRIAAHRVAPGAVLEGEIILEGSGGDIDNMEALAVRPGAAPPYRIAIMSDDNFNDWERTLLLEFDLEE